MHDAPSPSPRLHARRMRRLRAAVILALGAALFVAAPAHAADVSGSGKPKSSSSPFICKPGR